MNDGLSNFGRMNKSLLLKWAGPIFSGLLLLITPCSAAHSRRRPVARQTGEPRYDRSITTFSSDGRLLQVEYGMEASRRGDTVAAAVSTSNNKDDENNIIDVVIAVESSSSSKVHRIDHHVILLTSGLVGDGRALAASLRGSCQQHRLSFVEAPTVPEVARLAAKLQHDLTRMGGARPLGCSAIIVGVDSVHEQGVARLFQTEPGGTLEECVYCAAGKGREAAIISLRQASEDGQITQDRSSDDHLQRMLQTVVSAALGDRDDGDSSTGHKTVDGWIVRPDPTSRGGVSLTCVSNLNRQNVKAFVLPKTIQSS